MRGRTLLLVGILLLELVFTIEFGINEDSIVQAEPSEVPPSPTPPFADYGITASAGIGGTIFPEGAEFAYAGSTKVYTITPNAGYEILDVIVDGISQGKISTYTFSNVNSNHEISAKFISIQSTSPFLFAALGIVIAATVAGSVWIVMRSKKRHTAAKCL